MISNVKLQSITLLIFILLMVGCSKPENEIQEAVEGTILAREATKGTQKNEITSTQLHTKPSNIATNTITPTIEITPKITSTTPQQIIGYQKYHIEYEVVTYSPKVWIPIPKYWDGQGLISIVYLEISPAPTNWIREENGTEVIYWENTTGATQIYHLAFDVELAYIDISSAEKIVFHGYDENSYIFQKYTKPEVFIQSDSERVLNLANEIVGSEDSPYKQAKLIHEWMIRNIGYEPGDRDALSVLDRMGSDCAGKAHLYIALLRSLGIPSRTVAGIHSPGSNILTSGVWYPDKTMGYHVWTEIFLPEFGWAQVDPGSSTFEKINEHRIVTSKGTDIQIGNGFPQHTVSWLHLPYSIYSQIEDEPIRFVVKQIP
jgi:transglutaminase-like putative cysteine protease